MSDNALLNALLESVDRYIKRPENLDIIKRAFYVAEEQHKGQMRKGHNLPYITHPVGVAIILAELNAGPQTIAAALLHDTIEDTPYTKELMIKDFGKEIYEIVDGVTKIGKLKFKTDESQAEYHRKMLLATANDIRVVLVKIADRLHNIRTLEDLPRDRQNAIANETLEIYAPLAHRLGLFAIKAELEDTALKYNDPEMYYYVSGLIQSKRAEREKSIDEIIEEIRVLLQNNRLPRFSIKGRIKNINSIYKKMAIQKRDFEDIYDLLAIRIIVENIETCYKVLGLIHATYTPIPKRFKDYIAMPKPNMYQSLHTTVIAKDSTLFEVQIRTEEMDKIAEQGVAAHWAYKEGKAYSKEREQFEMAEKLKWYGDLLKMTTDSDEADKDSIEFVQDVKTDLLQAKVYVFTPQGKVIELPVGATPIDFAYRIHTNIGDSMIGCTVNNKITTIDTRLKTGDIVSIKTSKQAKPSPDWLKVVKTSQARTKIKAYLNKLNHDVLIQDGRAVLERELAKNGMNELPTDAFIKENFSKQVINNQEELFLEIGKGNISEKTVISKLIGKKPKTEEWLAKQLERAQKIGEIKRQTEQTIIVPGLDNPQLKISNCCLPIYGDKIVGYVLKTGGIAVHTNFCSNCASMEEERKIEVQWPKKAPNKTYPTWLIITVSEGNKVLSQILNVLSVAKISVGEIKVQTQKAVGGIIKLKVLVKDVNELTKVIANLRKLDEVYEVKRGIE